MGALPKLPRLQRRTILFVLGAGMVVYETIGQGRASVIYAGVALMGAPLIFSLDDLIRKDED